MHRALVLLALLPLAPLASAQGTLTLAQLEEPRKGVDATWSVVVTEEDRAIPRAVVYRNVPGNPFGLVVLDGAGNTLFERNGSRGIQTLPILQPGTYTFLVRFREGEFQVIEPAFGRTLNESVNASISDGTDAYVIAASRHYEFEVTGAVSVEWFDLQAAGPEALSTPVTRVAGAGKAYVLTLRGAEGAPYGIALRETDVAPTTPTMTEETPGLPMLALLGVVALLAVVRRRA